MKAVERGAALLDERLGPEWDEKIDLERLALGSTCDCIVGQLYQAPRRRKHAAYWRGIKELGVKGSEPEYGFDTACGRPGRRGFGSYWSLTAAWKRLIKSRRKAREAA